MEGMSLTTISRNSLTVDDGRWTVDLDRLVQILLFSFHKLAFGHCPLSTVFGLTAKDADTTRDTPAGSSTNPPAPPTPGAASPPRGARPG